MTALLGGCAVAVVFLVVSAVRDLIRARRRLRELREKQEEWERARGIRNAECGIRNEDGGAAR